MFLKGRITEEYYDTEYLRLSDLISQNEPDNVVRMDAKAIQEAFCDNWIEMYNALDKLGKKLFWRNVVKEIIVDKNMNVVDVIFL